MQDRRRLAERIGPVGVVAVAVFLLYLLTTCPTVYFGDSGELIAAADSLGVAHPPGYPLYTAVAGAALAIPLGEAAWRVNVLSALFGAALCAGVTLLLRGWTGSAPVAVAAAFGLAGARELWRVATVAEVYTMHLALIVGLLIAADGWRRSDTATTRGRWLVAAAVLLGAGLAHRPSIVLALPAVLVLGWRRGGVGRRHLALAVPAVVAIPLSAYGWMMRRAAAGPFVNWGAVDTPLEVLDHVTTRNYRFYVLGPAGWLQAEGWGRAVSMLLEGFGYVGLPLALLGIAFHSGRRTDRSRFAVSTAVLGGAWLAFGLAYGTEDVEVLFLPCLLATGLAAGLGLELLVRAGRGRVWLPALAGLALALLPVARHYRAADLGGVTAAADYGRDMLATVPPRGVLFVEGDNAFLLAYLQGVLGERPDVTVYDRNGVMFRDLLREPGTAPMAGESPLGFRVRREREFVETEARDRAVQFMSWPGYDPPSGWRFEPEGLFYRVLPASRPPLAPGRLWQRYHEAGVTAVATRTGDPFARTVAATYPLMRGERALFDGDAEAALGWFDRATALAESETIHNYVGTVFGRLGELERAEREFRRAIALKPVSIRAWNNLARAELLSGDTAAAREAWRRSLAIEPDQPEVLRLLGQYAELE